MGIQLIAVPTMEQMLEIVFDVLESQFISIIDHFLCAHTFAVLRYLRFERSILHRDISKGNILYFKDNLTSSTGATSDAQSGGANEAAQRKEAPLCLIKHLLGERYVEMLHKWVYTTK